MSVFDIDDESGTAMIRHARGFGVEVDAYFHLNPFGPRSSGESTRRLDIFGAQKEKPRKGRGFVPGCLSRVAPKNSGRPCKADPRRWKSCGFRIMSEHEAVAHDTDNFAASESVTLEAGHRFQNICCRSDSFQPSNSGRGRCGSIREVCSRCR